MPVGIYSLLKARDMLDMLTNRPCFSRICSHNYFSVAFGFLSIKRRTYLRRSALQRGLIFGKDLASSKGICLIELRLRL